MLTEVAPLTESEAPVPENTTPEPMLTEGAPLTESEALVSEK